MDTLTPAAKTLVSYSRRDLSFATRLAAALEKHGISVWIDLEDIAPSDDWLKAIEAAIEGTDAVVFVVSPDSVSTTSVCRQEVEHSLRHNKRLIPVVWRPVDTRTMSVPDAIGRLNWISFIEESSFDASIAALVAAIDTDLDWLKSHTRLVQSAVEWNTGRENSLLLRKATLRAAERWLELAPIKDPKPTGLQTEYILASRAAETRAQRRRLVAASIACLLIGVGASVAALEHAHAEQRRKESASRASSAEARFERSRRMDRSILLAASAFDDVVTYDALDATVAVGQAAFGVERFLLGPSGPVTGLCFMPGDRLITAHQDGRWVLWSLATASPLLSVAMPKRAAVRALACDAGSGRVAASSAEGALTIWQLDDSHAVQLLEADAPSDRLRFADGGAMLVGIGVDGMLVVRRATDWKRSDSFGIGGRNVSAVAVSDAGDLVAVGTFGSNDDGGSVSLWRTADHQKLFEQAPFPQGVADVALRNGPIRVVAAGVGGGVAGWAEDGTPVAPAVMGDGPNNTGLLARFDATGSRVALSAGNGLAVATVEAQPRFRRLAGHAGPVTQATFETKGSRIASASADGVVIVHRLNWEDELNGGWMVAGPDDAADDIAFSAAGDALVYQPPNGPLHRIELPEAVRRRGAHNSGGGLVAKPLAPLHAVFADSQAALLRAGSDTPVFEMIPELGSAVLATAVAENNSRWAAASGSAVRIASTAGRVSTPATLPSGFGDITALAISPDGGIVAVAGADLLQGNAAESGMAPRRLVLLDGETGRPLGDTIEMGGPAATSRLVFSLDGQLLASIDQSAVTVWVASPQLWLQRSCALLAIGASASDWQRVLPDVARPDGCPLRLSSR